MIYVVAIYLGFVFGWWTAEDHSVEDCLRDQVRLYGDLCAESSSGYESMNGRDAHAAGVRCAVEACVAN